MLRHYPFAHVYNLRDLGGYAVADDVGKDGRMTQYGRILRSDAPLQVSDEEFALLEQAGLSTVADLRRPDEAVERPCALAGRPGIRYYNCPVTGADQVPQREEDIPATYIAMTEKQAPMAQIFRLCAAPGAVLVHCSAGKDRTGVVCALLLHLAGVALPDILADYQVSHTYIRPLLARLWEAHPEMPMHTGFSRPEYMEQFLTLFLARYGSVAGYLAGLGLAQGEIAALREKLLGT